MTHSQHLENGLTYLDRFIITTSQNQKPLSDAVTVSPGYWYLYSRGGSVKLVCRCRHFTVRITALSNNSSCWSYHLIFVIQFICILTLHSILVCCSVCWCVCVFVWSSCPPACIHILLPILCNASCILGGVSLHWFIQKETKSPLFCNKRSQVEIEDCLKNMESPCAGGKLWYPRLQI